MHLTSDSDGEDIIDGITDGEESTDKSESGVEVHLNADSGDLIAQMREDQMEEHHGTPRLDGYADDGHTCRDSFGGTPATSLTAHETAALTVDEARNFCSGNLRQRRDRLQQQTEKAPKRPCSSSRGGCAVEAAIGAIAAAAGGGSRGVHAVFHLRGRQGVAALLATTCTCRAPDEPDDFQCACPVIINATNEDEDEDEDLAGTRSADTVIELISPKKEQPPPPPPTPALTPTPPSMNSTVPPPNYAIIAAAPVWHQRWAFNLQATHTLHLLSPSPILRAEATLPFSPPSPLTTIGATQLEGDDPDETLQFMVVGARNGPATPKQLFRRE